MTNVLRHAIYRVTLSLVAITLILGGMMTWYVGGLLVAPAPAIIGEVPADFDVDTITLESDSGATIRGWHSKGEKGKGVVVLLHGIRGNRLSMVERARWLDSLGYGTVLIDLQAHGESDGKHITAGFLERHDVSAAVEFVRRKYPDEPIGVIGMSLGGASALLASPLGVDALVLESVYPDIDTAIYNRVSARLGSLGTVPSALLLMQLQPRLGISPEALRPIDHIADVNCPVFVLSGTEDIHTTAAETKELFAHAVEPKQLWLVEGAAHVDIMKYATESYCERVAEFFARHMAPALQDIR